MYVTAKIHSSMMTERGGTPNGLVDRSLENGVSGIFHHESLAVSQSQGCPVIGYSAEFTKQYPITGRFTSWQGQDP